MYQGSRLSSRHSRHPTGWQAHPWAWHGRRKRSEATPRGSEVSLADVSMAIIERGQVSVTLN